MANLCCSVDLEPRTLKRGQMHHAREVAVGIFQKMEPVVASNVLIQEEGQVISMEMEEVVESTDEELCPTPENMVLESVGSSQHCSCANPSTDEPVDYDGHLIREPHTAPF